MTPANDPRDVDGQAETDRKLLWRLHEQEAETARIERETLDARRAEAEQFGFPFVEPAAVPTGHAFEMPGEYRVDVYGQDYRTLLALLDSATTRGPMIGAGAFEWCQMRLAALYNGRQVQDSDVSTIREKLEGYSTPKGKPLRYTPAEVWEAINHLAKRKQVHPARAWLNGLMWDGVPRLGSELPSQFGYRPDELQATFFRRWMIAAVARAMDPGCKQETVLVLVGPQGWGKTRFFEALGRELYSSETIGIGDKDGKMLLRRAWIIEWGELQSMRRAKDVEQIKDFLSRQTDQFRPPYGRAVVDAPRSCVIGGTTNNPQYLSDPTGNRRFWTVELKRAPSIDWVSQQRDQLFGEAVALYRAPASCRNCTARAGRCDEHQWWLTPTEDGQLAALNEDHEDQHPWFDLIADWIGKRGAMEETTAAEVMIDALNMSAERVGERGSEMSVSRVMRQLGWIKGRRREGGKLRWVYSRPPRWEAP